MSKIETDRYKLAMDHLKNVFDLIESVLLLKQGGLSNYQISELKDIPESYVYLIVKEYLGSEDKDENPEIQPTDD